MRKIFSLIIIYFLLLSQCIAGSLTITDTGTFQKNPINQTGLVGFWDFNLAGVSANPVVNGTTVYGNYGSDSLVSVNGATFTTGPDGIANNAITLNGSTQYVAQAALDTKQGTVIMATVATGALFNDTGQDFTPWAGKSGISKPYMLVATDTGGKVAWGYIGEEGTGETLGSELVVNGDFSAWTGDNPNSWTVNGTENASNYVTQNPAGQCQLVSDGTSFGIYQSINTVGKLYKYSIDVKSTSGSSVLGASSISYRSLSSVAVLTGYYNAYQNYVEIKRGASCNLTCDDISIKEVTALAANTGVKIYSTKNGSTQSWASVESGFLPNSVASYEVRSTDFQITGAMTLGVWVKINTIGVIASKSYAYNDRNTFLFQVEPDSTLNLYITENGTTSKSVSGIPINTGVWNFVTFVFNPSTSIIVYKNGVQAGIATNSIPATLYDNYQSVKIGTRGSMSLYFNGSIAKLFIYGRALSATEIWQMYQNLPRAAIIQ